MQVNFVADVQTFQSRTGICGFTGGPTINAFRPYWGIRLSICPSCGGNAAACNGFDLTAAPTVPNDTLSRICPTGFSTAVPNPSARLKNLAYYTPVCVADPICGYGQPYNITSKRCVVPTSPVSTDSSVRSCPRYLAYDTYMGTCIYVGDLQTPTSISAATLAQCPAGTSPVPGTKSRFACQGPATIAPPVAVLENIGGVVKVVAVEGVAAFPLPVPAGIEPTTVSFTGPNGLVMTKTSGGLGDPAGTPVYVPPVTGSISTLKPDNSISTIAYVGNGPGVATTPTAVNCTGIYNLTSLYSLSQTDPGRAAACIQLAQSGCPTISQLQTFAFYNSSNPANTTGGGAAAGVSMHEAFQIWAGKFKQWLHEHV